jgi:1,4-alpha-glucan branching enzyme
VERVDPVERELAASTWGTGKDLSTWDSPAVADVAFGARAAELRTVAAAAAAGGAGRPDVLRRAARELLALQSSDWAFQITGQLSADYPEQRLAGHAAQLDLCLEALRDSALVPPDPALRNLAPDLELGPLLAP